MNQLNPDTAEDLIACKKELHDWLYKEMEEGKSPQVVMTGLLSAIVTTLSLSLTNDEQCIGFFKMLSSDEYIKATLERIHEYQKEGGKK